MIQKIRSNRLSKGIAIYLALMIFLQVTAPMQAYALTGGPDQPEFNSFTPIGTSDMVDLSTGNLNYNIPIMDVGGYPISLGYSSGASMDQEASWVGLGWDLSVGQIARQVRGLPDDFDGDEMVYENNMKENVTVGANFTGFGTAFGFTEDTGLSINTGFGVRYNNYEGFGFTLTNGLSFQIADNLSVGLQMASSASEGVSVSPSVSYSVVRNAQAVGQTTTTGSIGTALNSRKGIESFTLSASRSKVESWKVVNGRTLQDKASQNSVGGSVSFIDATFTPSKRVGMMSTNFMFNMNIEGEFWGIEPGLKFSGYRTSQGIKESEKIKTEHAFGYENTYNATDKDILDFNREKDRAFSTYSTTLPVVNHTYDIYSVQGQGVSGMFRPYRGQVGYVHDNDVNDNSTGGDLGIELGGGGGGHWGVDFTLTIGESSTKTWRSNNQAVPKFEEKTEGNRPDYEKVYFKNVGGFHVDSDYYDILSDKLGQYDPIRFGIGGSYFARKAESKYIQNTTNGSDSDINITNAVKREKRINRNQIVQKLNREETERYGFDRQFSPYSLQGKHKHHTSEIRIIQDGGSRYVYGRPAYNVVKKEVTFDVSGRLGNCNTGLVSYTPGSHNSTSNNADGDQYFERITTPSYAHTYLLTSVLSPDYSDLTNNGPTDDDLGSYTKFVYDDTKTVNNPYKWRVPYTEDHATYNEGLKSSKSDDKGTYLYGEKELLYIKKIETKTHVAIFEISARKDAYGVTNEDGGGSAATSSKMYKLDKISLYSKPEYLADGQDATPIKVAHFRYDYSLCKGVDNNFDSALTDSEIENQGGKLTLKKIYFTYRNSNMGKYTPYTFDYSTFNPDYDIKAYDTWGNYKPNDAGAGCGVNDALTNAEFAYVDQRDKAAIDQYASAWLLQSIHLPSGGLIELQYESDDYAFVQDQQVMQMFKVTGVGNQSRPTTLSQVNSNILYSGPDETDKLYIKLTSQVDNPEDFMKHYIKKLNSDGEVVYFRFLLNMSQPGSGNDDKYDYVTGYLELDKGFDVFTINNEQYASIPIKKVQKGDGLNSGALVNPIAKAGWYFGRTYLNRFVYTNSTDQSTDNLEEIVTELLGAVPAMADIVRSPNKQLIERKIASRFVPDKSWIRLMHPDEQKLGGGCRVKRVVMHDQWQVMTNHEADDNYRQQYGQEYSYVTTGGKSSGVATYEPLGNKENPLVQPFYDRQNPGKLLAPDEKNYIEKPLGECFYPAPNVTYARVSVSNLPRTKYENGETSEVKRHATGKVVTEFFTSKDYPTIADYTPLMSRYDKSDPLARLHDINVLDHLTLSQGFLVHTNDMNGKIKTQYVYAENIDSPISGVDYFYSESTDDNAASENANKGKLNNTVVTVDSDGRIEERQVGVDFDVINDFRHSSSVTTSGGLNINTATIPIGVFPVFVPTPIPSFSRHENQIKTAVTTKVIHSSGILRSKRVFDAGASVTTKNLAWDAETGEVLLTEVVNEYSDKYYSFNFPAYWSYDGMAQGAKNIDMAWKLKRVIGAGDKYQFFTSEYKASDFLIDGDELWVKPETTGSDEFKAYVVNVEGTKFSLISEQGLLVTQDMLEIGEFKIIRSGHRNMQAASMASITSMYNPLHNEDGTNGTTLPENIYDSDAWHQYRVVNATAIEYEDLWAAQCECRMPVMKYENGAIVFDYSNSDANALHAYNPYRYNIKGNWRPKRSYAYLTARNYDESPSPRNTGFFMDFKPFYTYNLQGGWIVNASNKARWTYASEVTQYNPYGFEIENKDALDRFSSAIYGYNFRFPVAVASNTRYSELAYDGFEDYEFSVCDTTSHFSFNGSIIPNQVRISSEQAHTGRKSLKLEPGTKATVKKQIIPCATPANP